MKVCGRSSARFSVDSIGYPVYNSNRRGQINMLVNSTDVQNNFGKYLDMSSNQEIVITRNGLPIARLVGVNTTISFLSDRLVGLVPPDVNEKEIRSERLERQ
jgi:prevent-host-death family protein